MDRYDVQNGEEMAVLGDDLEVYRFFYEVEKIVEKIFEEQKSHSNEVIRVLEDRNDWILRHHDEVVKEHDEHGGGHVEEHFIDRGGLYRFEYHGGGDLGDRDPHEKGGDYGNRESHDSGDDNEDELLTVTVMVMKMKMETKI